MWLWYCPEYFPDRPPEEELIELYKKSGYDCIVVWEDDVKSGLSSIELDRFSRERV
jgi:hypothetical protein